MSTIPKLTMMGLYNYDDALFDDMRLPEGIVKADLINTFLLNYGEYPVIYPRWDTMKFALGIWSKKWYHSIERIIYAMTEEYNPLHNFDRHEEYTDEEAKSGNTSEQGSASNTITNDRTVRTLDLTDTTEGTTTNNVQSTGTETGSTENTISAYNEDAYQPDNKSDTDRQTGATESGTGTNSGTDTHTGTDTSVRNAQTAGTDSRTGTSAEDRTLQHSGHLYGNIGVTESTTMLQHELDLRSEQNILDIVSEMLFKEVCIFTY